MLLYRKSKECYSILSIYFKTNKDKEKPLVLFIEYLEPPTFFMYKHIHFGNPNLLFLVYQDNKNNEPNLIWTSNPFAATIFKYPYVKYIDYLSTNIPAKAYFTGYKKAYDEYPYFFKKVVKKPNNEKKNFCKNKDNCPIIGDFNTKFILDYDRYVRKDVNIFRFVDNKDKNKDNDNIRY